MEETDTIRLKVARKLKPMFEMRLERLKILIADQEEATESRALMIEKKKKLSRHVLDDDKKRSHKGIFHHAKRTPHVINSTTTVELRRSSSPLSAFLAPHLVAVEQPCNLDSFKTKSNSPKWIKGKLTGQRKH
ncbi:hypothetical protein OPV22_015967 [Ensete ventricosum]|uniref:Uncharacterized protein n=1 Tax=Ensete ventricosum TaxID=4639 RepID=A0AAV8RAN7_ENSVE|nr:hypothetical protein OPV22_015967 [Ensete ventricosum]